MNKVFLPEEYYIISVLFLFYCDYKIDCLYT